MQHCSSAAAWKASPHLLLGLPLHPRPCSAPGTYANGTSTWQACLPCADGFYRTGDASANNNVCLRIPAGGPAEPATTALPLLLQTLLLLRGHAAQRQSGGQLFTTAAHSLAPCAGFKEKPRASTTYDRAELVECGKGEVAYWDWAASPVVRVPANPELCQACTGGNKYAPRTGARASWLLVCLPAGCAKAALACAPCAGKSACTLLHSGLTAATHHLHPCRDERLPALPRWADPQEDRRRPAWLRLVYAVQRQHVPARRR